MEGWDRGMGMGVGWGEVVCGRVLDGIDLRPRGFIHLGG